MKRYIGIKAVIATAMNLVDAEELLGRKIKPGNEDGYLVEYEDGYKSWSPKDAFEKAYRPTDGMTFGHAIEAMKANKRVARAGWNGKGMWLRIVVPGGDNLKPDMGYENLPYVEMKTADYKLVPWLASQTDLLAEDWMLV